MWFCPDEDGMNVSGGMPNPMAGSHPRGNPDADPPGTIAVSGGEFVNTGSVCGGNVALASCEDEADGGTTVVDPTRAKLNRLG